MPDQSAPPQTAADLFGTALAKISERSLSVIDLVSVAMTLNEAGRADLSAEMYKLWIAFNGADPHLYVVYFNYGTCLQDIGDQPGAINALREGIRLNPDFQPAHINLGRALEDGGQVDAAVSQWSAFTDRLAAVTGEALAHKVTALQQIGRVLEDQQRDAAAEEALKRSLQLDPSQLEAAQHWISLRQRQCRWPVVDGWERVPREKLLAGISPLSLANLSDDPLFQLAAADRYCRHLIGRVSRPAGRRGPFRPLDRPPGKLRIGYVSSDLREHAVGFAMTDLLEEHDRTRFEVFAYYSGIARDDPTKRRIQATVDRWTDISSLDDAAAAGLIAEDKIDILVDLNGYTKSARTKIFALLPAPVAVNWFGFPGTMGSPYHHYLIADAYVIPEGEEMFYSESVRRLPCYQPNDRYRSVSELEPSRSDEGLPEGAMVFCCLNGMQKLTEPVFKRWMTILDRVPDGVLWLLGGTADTNLRLHQLAEGLGIAPERLIFAEKKANPDHVARYALADLFLDTFPYGAHTTAADALWMGVPVLTLSGRSFASRVCGSVVTAAGLDELIAKSPEDYVERAVALGRDRQALEALTLRLTAGRDSCLLFDTPRLTRGLEELYLEMWADFEAGRRPNPQLDNLDIYHAIGLDLDIENSDRPRDDTDLSRYREGLADWDETYPIRPDWRLWTHRNAPHE